MRRYVTKPRSFMANVDVETDAENYMSRTVFEPDPTPEPTGLYDASGNELYAINEIGPIGYVRFREGFGG